MYPDPNVSKIRFNLAEIHSHYNINILNVLSSVFFKVQEQTVQSCHVNVLHQGTRHSHGEGAMDRLNFNVVPEVWQSTAGTWTEGWGAVRCGAMIHMYSMSKKGNKH